MHVPGVMGVLTTRFSQHFPMIPSDTGESRIVACCQRYGSHMKLMPIALTVVLASALVVPPASASQSSVNPQRQPLPMLAMCVGAGQGDAPAVSTVSRRPSTVIVDCPDGGDDDPRGSSADTYVNNITWTRWARQRAVGSGTFNVPTTVCSYTSPADGTPDEVAAMCASSGDVGNYIKVETYDANIVLSKPKRLKKRQRTFTQVALTFPNGGPDSKTSMTFTPPRKAQE